MSDQKIFWHDRGYNCYELRGLEHGIGANVSWTAEGYKVNVLGRTLKARPKTLELAKDLAVRVLKAWLCKASLALSDHEPE